jgi:hypothetical protein
MGERGTYVPTCPVDNGSDADIPDPIKLLRLPTNSPEESLVGLNDSDLMNLGNINGSDGT